MTQTYTRDLIGYNGQPPKVEWPNKARLAVSFVLNYEESGERCILHGDSESEAFLSEIVGAQPYQGVRHPSMESMYEYGSRAGVWRILALFKKHEVPLTIFAVAMAAQRHPEVVQAMHSQGHEICSHGLRWIDYQYMEPELERKHMLEAIHILTQITRERPLCWYTGRKSPNTRDLVMQEGGFAYDSDDYNDDLPFWSRGSDGTGKAHLVIPYTLDTNDMRFATPQGFHTSEQFFEYLKDAFDVLYEEAARAPTMLSIGMHCRILGRPARLKAIQSFLEYVAQFDDVWCARRINIARHWQQYHPASKMIKKSQGPN